MYFYKLGLLRLIIFPNNNKHQILSVKVNLKIIPISQNLLRVCVLCKKNR